MLIEWRVGVVEAEFSADLFVKSRSNQTNPILKVRIQPNKLNQIWYNEQMMIIINKLDQI